MMIRVLSCLVAVALMVVFGWWFLAEGDDGGQPSLNGDSVGDRAAAPASVAHTSGEQPAAGGGAGVARVSTSPFSEPSAPSPAPEGFMVVFRDGEGRAQPAADVEVSIGEPPLGRETEPWKRLTADATGKVMLKDIPPQPLRVFARKDGLVGYRHVPVKDVGMGQQVEVTMKPVRRVEVSVVDQDGEPVGGVPVLMGQGYSFNLEVHWTSDPDGLARFEITPRDHGAYRAKKFEPKVRLPAEGRSEPAGASVPWVEDGVTKARIEISRGVALRVRVVDDEGQVVRGRRKIRWDLDQAAGEEVFFSGLVLPGWGKSDSRCRSFDDGETVLRGFAPGQKVDLVLREKGRCDVKATTRVPEQGDGVVDVVMTRGARAPVVEVPLVDESGAPVTEGTFQIVTGPPGKVRSERTGMGVVIGSSFGRSFLTHGSSETTVERSPNADGIVRLTVAPDKPLELVVRRVQGNGTGMGLMPADPSTSQELFKGTIGICVPGEVRRLDPVQVLPLPVIVAGQVQDEKGEPVKGALVRLFPPAEMKDLWFGGGMQMAEQRVRTDGDGRFAILGMSDPAGWRVFARVAGGPVSERVPFSPGETGVVLVVRAVGSLRGRVVSAVEEALPVIRMHGEDRLRDGHLQFMYGELQFNATCKPDGTFVVGGLPPGRYRATVYLERYEVLTVEGIVIEGGGESVDPRLDGVTVGDHLERTAVTVRSPEGDPVARANVSLRAPEAEPSSGPRLSHRTDEEGIARVILPKGAVRDVRVNAKGFLAFKAEGRTFPFEAELDRGCTLTVGVSVSGGNLDSDDRVATWLVSLSGESATRKYPDAVGGLFRAPDLSASSSMAIEFSPGIMGATGRLQALLAVDGREVTIEQVPPGTWKVMIHARLRQKEEARDPGDVGWTVPRTTKKLELGSVEVTPGTARQRVEFTVDWQALSTLLDK